MKYYEGCEEITREKTRDFQAKMKLGYDFKKAYAARRAWEFYNHPEVAGRCYVAVGGLDSITLFLFFRSIGIDVPATSVSMLEDRSIQRVHKALGVKGLLPVINQKTKRPYNKVEVIREYGFPVLSKEIAGKIYTLQHPTEKNATLRRAIMTGETGAYGGYRKGTRMKMSQKWLEIFGGPENEREGTDYKTAPFQVSELCCYYLKERPCDDYAKESGRFPYMWYGYLVAATLFGLTRGETATAILGIALVAGAVKAYRERRRQRAQKEAIDKAIQLWEALMAKQQYEMPASEWRRLRPFYTLTVEALKNERDRAARRGGVKQVRENGEGA